MRQWCAAVLDRGFTVRKGKLILTPPPKVRSGAFLREEDAQRSNGPTAEDLALGSQFAAMPRGLADQGSHAVMRWWVGQDEDARPAPMGVGAHQGSVQEVGHGSVQQADEGSTDEHEELLADDVVDAW